MRVSPAELSCAAHAFEEASQGSEAMVARLEKQMEKLKESWADAGQQVFYQYFEEWRQHMSGVSEVLRAIAQNLREIAERYGAADR